MIKVLDEEKLIAGSILSKNNAPLAIVITDGEGIIEALNPKAETMFGYKSIELIGKPIECLMPEGLRENHVKHRGSYLAKPYTRLMGAGLDLMGRRKDGEEFPIEIGLSYNHYGDGIQVISYISDITRRKQIEQERLDQAEIEKISMERELQMAHQVQVGLLPRETPKIPGWSFAVKWLPAHKVSGDFYDFILRKDGSVDLVIADVVDKGMPAALLMAYTRTALRASMNGGSSPEDGVNRTNQLMCQESSQGLFVTLFLARLDTRTGETLYVNAGHNPPLYYSYEQDQITDLTKTGMALGIEKQAIYEHRALTFDTNDFILFYTDGVTEATNANGQDFGTERLQQVISDHRYATAEDIVTALERAVDEFTAPALPSDDITIMVVKRL